MRAHDILDLFPRWNVAATPGVSQNDTFPFPNRTRMNAPRLSLALGSLLLSGACASAPSVANGGLATATDAGCRPAPIPEVLLTVSEAVDSAALHTALTEFWEESELPAGRASVSLAWDGYGANVRRQVVDHDLRPEVADSVQALVYAHRTTQAEREVTGDWGVRLDISMAPEPAFSVARQTYCPPRPLNVREVNEYIHGRYPARGDTRLHSRTQVYVRVGVDRSGRVRDVRIERPSGTRIDQFAEQLARELTFRPATMDGIPMDAVAIVRLGDLPW
jgi:TonB family protein